MNLFEEATKLGDERFDREKLLSITSKLIARFRLLNAQVKPRCVEQVDIKLMPWIAVEDQP